MSGPLFSGISVWMAERRLMRTVPSCLGSQAQQATPFGHQLVLQDLDSSVLHVVAWRALSPQAGQAWLRSASTLIRTCSSVSRTSSRSFFEHAARISGPTSMNHATLNASVRMPHFLSQPLISVAASQDPSPEPQAPATRCRGCLSPGR